MNKQIKNISEVKDIFNYLEAGDQVEVEEGFNIKDIKVSIVYTSLLKKGIIIVNQKVETKMIKGKLVNYIEQVNQENNQRTVLMVLKGENGLQ